MADRATAAVERARDLLDLFGRGGVHKTIWGSPAGKKRLAERLVALLPAHKTYVEPFAGSAAGVATRSPVEGMVIVRCLRAGGALDGEFDADTRGLGRFCEVRTSLRGGSMRWLVRDRAAGLAAVLTRAGAAGWACV